MWGLKKKLENNLWVWLVILFFWSLLVNLLFIDFTKGPTLFPDSFGYIRLAKDVFDLSLPFYKVRTPSYPLFLSAFSGNLNNVVYIQVVLGAFSAVFLYLIIVKIVKNRLWSFLMTMVLVFDYQIVNFQASILTEGLVVPLFLLFIYLHLVKGRKKLFWSRVVVDLFLIFLKPMLLVLPIGFYIARLVFGWQDKRLVKRAVGAIIINLVFISGWGWLYYRRTGLVGLTSISEINMLGKMTHYGFLDEEYEQPPELVRETLRIYESNKRKMKNPYYIISDLAKKGMADEKSIKQINGFFINGHINEYLLETAKLVPQVVKSKRSYYIRNEDLMAGWYRYFDHFMNLLNSLKLLGLIFAGLVLWRQWRRQGWSKIFGPVLLITLSCSYVVMAVAAFSSYEHTRLRLPVELFFNFLLFWMVLSVATKLVGFVRRLRCVV